MASLRRLPNSPFWIACYTLPDGRRTQRSTKTTDRAKAQRIANKYEDASRAASTGRLTESQARRVIGDIFAIAHNDILPTATIKGFLEAWLKRKELEADERTHERYQGAVKHVFSALGAKGGRDLWHLNSKQIAEARDAIAMKLSANSANFCVKVLRAALNQARRDGLVDVNEASRVPLLQQSRRGTRQPFTLEQVQKLLSNADDEWKGMILFGLYTGLRLGDIATLNWANVHLERREVEKVTEKTGRQVVIPLAQPLCSYLRSQGAYSSSTSVFPNAAKLKTRNPHGGPLSNQFYKIMVAAGMKAKRTHKRVGSGRSAKRQVSELSFHSLRHTATSLLKNAGVSDVVARDIIGHESEAVSRNYTRIDIETKRKAIDAMPLVLS